VRNRRTNKRSLRTDKRATLVLRPWDGCIR